MSNWGEESAGKEGTFYPWPENTRALKVGVVVVFSMKSIGSRTAAQWGELVIKWKESTHVQPAERAPFCTPPHTLPLRVSGWKTLFAVVHRSVLSGGARNTPLYSFPFQLTHLEILWRWPWEAKAVPANVWTLMDQTHLAMGKKVRVMAGLHVLHTFHSFFTPIKSCCWTPSYTGTAW